MAPDTYGEILARNIRAARSRAGIGQENLAARMRALGFEPWIRQTVGATERRDASKAARRRPTAEEIIGLALALGTTVPGLMAPVDEHEAVELQKDGPSISVNSLAKLASGLNDRSLTWDGDKPVFADGKSAWFAGDPDAPEVVKARWAEAEDES